MTPLRVLAVASELFPLVKTGGLADVVGALPGSLLGHGVETRTLLPGYRAVLAQAVPEQPVHAFEDLFGGPARLLGATTAEGAELLILEAPHLYNRPGGPYQGPDGRDWPDNAMRFAALAWAAREVALGALESWRPDIVHAHDWQAGLAPAYLKLAAGNPPGTVMTVHNLAFQGQFPTALLAELRLPAEAWATHGVEYYGSIGFLKAGLFYADRLSTVSPTYAREIQTPAAGMGLDGLLRKRAGDLVGIVNGIDENAWDPAADPHLMAPYDERRLAARQANKTAIRERLGLEHDDAPLFCVVSRLTWQKGIDLLLEALPRLLHLGGQLALLGSGDTSLEAGFADAARGHPGRVGCIFGYDEPFSHLLQGGADAIVIPSRFEPCGLTQLYGLRYGTVPIVARVGGLADTVIDANEAALADGVATGFKFAPVTADALIDALVRATALYADQAGWQALQRRGMSRELGWSARAAAYARLYRDVLAGRAPA
jgi:starch synthase